MPSATKLYVYSLILQEMFTVKFSSLQIKDFPFNMTVDYYEPISNSSMKVQFFIPRK